MLKALVFQLVESTVLSIPSRWFQTDSQPATPLRLGLLHMLTGGGDLLGRLRSLKRYFLLSQVMTRVHTHITHILHTYYKHVHRYYTDIHTYYTDRTRPFLVGVTRCVERCPVETQKRKTTTRGVFFIERSDENQPEK